MRLLGALRRSAPLHLRLPFHSCHHQINHQAKRYGKMHQAKRHAKMRARAQAIEIMGSKKGDPNVIFVQKMVRCVSLSLPSALWHLHVVTFMLASSKHSTLRGQHDGLMMVVPRLTGHVGTENKVQCHLLRRHGPESLSL